MKGLVYHKLKGIRGWSNLNISKIDVYKVMDIYYEKRLFCILNKDYPYKLIIEYHAHPKYIYNITKRYKTEIEVQNEVSEIILKQSKIESLKSKFIHENKDEIIKFNNLFSK